MLRFTVAILLSIVVESAALGGRIIVRDQNTNNILFRSGYIEHSADFIAGSGDRIAFSNDYELNGTQVWNIENRTQTHQFSEYKSGSMFDDRLAVVRNRAGDLGLLTFDLTHLQEDPIEVIPNVSSPRLYNGEMTYRNNSGIYLHTEVAGPDQLIASGTYYNPVLSESYVAFSKGASLSTGVPGPTIAYFDRENGTTFTLPAEINIAKQLPSISGNRLAFQVNYLDPQFSVIFKSDIFSWDLASEGPPINLTNNPPSVFSEIPSVFGDKIAYATRYSARSDIFVYDIEQRTLSQITHNNRGTYIGNLEMFDGKIAYELRGDLVPEPSTGCLAAALSILASGYMLTRSRIVRAKS